MGFNFFLCQGGEASLVSPPPPHDQDPPTTHKAVYWQGLEPEIQLYEVIRCPFCYRLIHNWFKWFNWFNLMVQKLYFRCVAMFVRWRYHDVSPNSDPFTAQSSSTIMSLAMGFRFWSRTSYFIGFGSRFEVNGFRHRDRPPYLHHSSMHKHLLVLDGLLTRSILPPVFPPHADSTRHQAFLSQNIPAPNCTNSPNGCCWNAGMGFRCRCGRWRNFQVILSSWANSLIAESEIE